jgi:Tfp pilus assembly protein, pilus retraction ATPase PilT
MSNEHDSPFAGRHDGSKFEGFAYLDPQAFNDILKWATERKASDITFQPDTPVMADFGGQIKEITHRAINSAEIEGIVRYVYGENGPAEVMGGFDLDPAHEIRDPATGFVRRYRVNVTGGRMLGGNDGMQITVRTLPNMPVDYRKLNLEQDIIDNFRPEQGMVLVTGPTGSGKSTLLSSLIRRRVEQEDANEKVLEYSAPIEYVYDGVRMPSSVVFQTHAGKHLRPRNANDEQSIFAHCVRNALRRKPTIIIIGEARDRATIEASVEAALTGHVLYTTMHTIGVAETLRRAVMPFPEDARRAMAVDIMESLRMIVSQLLLPRVGGGRVACREYMVFSRAVREEFLRANVDTWPRVARRILAEERALGRTMAKSALDLLYRGEISEEVYERVAAPGKHA